jgi:hypothetical protein
LLLDYSRYQATKIGFAPKKHFMIVSVLIRTSFEQSFKAIDTKLPSKAGILALLWEEMRQDFVFESLDIVNLEASAMMLP